MNFNYYYLLTVFLAAFTSAQEGLPFSFYGPEIGFYACNIEVRRSASFCKKALFSCLCANENYLATFAGCLAYKNRNTTESVDRLVHICKRNGNVTIDEDWFSGSYSYFLENAKSASEIEGFNKSAPIDVPLKLAPAELKLYQDAYKQYLDNFDDSLYYSASTLGYWLLIMIICAVSHWGKFLFPGLTKKLTQGPVNMWRKYVSMPATFRKKKTQEQSCLKFFDFFIPSRFESIAIAIFYILVIVINAINTEYVENDPVLLGGKYRVQLRYVSIRTGIIATLMMPLVILFGGRNNFLQWLTGINFNTFIVYHRHIARVMFTLVVIHSVGFTIIFKHMFKEAAERYFYWGIIGTVAGGIILFQAMLFFRRRWYEIFLLIHIAMAVLYVAGTWIHVDELGYIWFVYPAVAVWCFDRLVRIGRLIAFGFPKAEVTLLANDTLKVVVPKPSYWKSIPGGHAFIHFMKPTYFWQSHPFTFVDTPDNKSIILFCKVKGGVTHSLYRMLVNQPGQTAKITVGVEGPYGELTAAKYADSAVFIAGGNGMPGIYSEVVAMAKNPSAGTKNMMKLIWVIRNYSSLTWFQEELELLKETNIQTTIYVTRPEISCSDNNSEDKKIESKNSESGIGTESLKSTLSHIEFREGRPSIEGIVTEEIRESSGSVGFVACGHPVMVDEVRYYTCQNINNAEHKRVDFYEQLQVWS